MDKPIAWIKARELTYVKAVVEHGATEWKTNLGLKPEDGDVPLYTAPPQREWQGLTDEQVQHIEMSASSKLSAIYLAEAELKGKNAL